MVFHEITQDGDRARARGDARHRPRPRRRAGDPAHPRPALRLRGLAGALEEDHAGPFRGPCAVGRDPARGRARTRAHGFVAAAYWDLLGTFAPGSFEARLAAVGGRRVAQGRDFGPDGQLRGEVVVLDEAAGPSARGRLEGRPFAVRSVEEKPYTRRPAAPFSTSTLQQEASRKLRFSAQTTMRVAQRLYENGYITYMRTDSIALSETAVTAARAQAAEVFGADTVPERPRSYTRAVTNAQEAHEAIRPAGDSVPHPRPGARAVARRVGALRADLEAHDRLADEGCGWFDGRASGSARRRARTRTSSSERPAP